MVAFIPGVASDRTRNVVGYIILLLQAGILVLGFMMQGVWDLVQLIKRWVNEERPDAYGLHQLERRQPSRSDMRASPHVDVSNASTPDEDAQSPSSYFEPPRSTSRTSSTLSWETRDSGITDNLFSRVTLSGSFDALRGPPSPTIEESVPLSRAMCSSPAAVDEYRSSDKESSPGTPAESERTEALGPRWNDYSFRDLHGKHLTRHSGDI
ncbi:hypothetical protein SLS64_002811 [Diaporthe eres]